MTLPTSDKSLRVLMNCPSFNLKYPTSFINGEPEIAYPFEWLKNVVMVTDLCEQRAELDGNPMEAVQRYELAREAFDINLPSTPIGSYISGSNTEPYRGNSTYPQRAIRQELFWNDELWPNGSVKYSKHDASFRFAAHVTREVKRRGLKQVFIDNLAGTQAVGMIERLEDVINHVNNLADALHSEGIMSIGNISGEPASGVSDEEWAAFCNCRIDGWTWEMVAWPTMRNDPALINLSLNRWQQMLKTKGLIFIANQGNFGGDPKDFTIEKLSQMAQFLAAMAMLVRSHGNKIFIAWPMWLEDQLWELWPQDLGPATDRIYQSHIDPLTFTRPFTNGRVICKFGDNPTGSVVWK